MNDNLHIAKGKNLTLFNPSFIDDYGFTPEEFRVFARIMRRAAGENSLGCFETVPSMAMTLGISKRLVRESLRILRECKAITVIEREGQSHLISFNTCDKWLPPHSLIEIRHKVSGTRIERDRERKMTPVGNATRSGNAPPPLSETLHKGIPIKSIPILSETDTVKPKKEVSVFYKSLKAFQEEYAPPTTKGLVIANTQAIKTLEGLSDGDDELCKQIHRSLQRDAWRNGRVDWTVVVREFSFQKAQRSPEPKSDQEQLVQKLDDINLDIDKQLYGQSTH